MMTRQTFLFVILAALLVLWYVAAAGGGFPLDDSWIHQTFGRNLALRGEWAFLPGQPVAASTSALYTGLLSIGYRLGIPYLLWTHGLGVIALASTALLGVVWAKRALPDAPFAPWIVGLALLTTWHHVWAAAAGMETLIFGGLVLALLIWPWWDGPASPRGRFVWGAAFGGLSALTVLARPEGIAAVGLVGAVMLWREIVQAQEYRQSASRAQHSFADFVAAPLQWICGAGLAFLVVMAPYLWLNVQLTGGLLPNTAAAKFQQHAILQTLPLIERMGRLFMAIIAGGQVALVPGMILYVVWGLMQARSANDSTHRPLWPWVRWLLPLGWALGLIVLYAWRLPADYQHGRYVMPALPALVLMGSAGLCLALQFIADPRKSISLASRLRRVVVRAWTITIVLLYAYYLVAGREIYRVDVAIIDGEMVNAAHWIAAPLPPDDLLAIHDIGAVGYFAERPLLDIAGLITPEVVPLIGQPDALWALMEERGAQYLLAFPDQIPGGRVDDPRLCPVYSTDATVTQQVGHANMQVYRLAWDAQCE